MHNNRIWCAVLWVSIACLFNVRLHAQAETSAALSGRLVDEDRKAISGAKIVITHEPTGRTSRTQTNSRGYFFLRGLEVGGPYFIEPDADGFRPQKSSVQWLGLGEELAINITLQRKTSHATDPFHVLEKVVVVADNEHNDIGSSRQLSRREVESLPSIGQSLNEVARLDPRIVWLDEDYAELSAAGQHPRSNALLIDGINMNELYGINSNGLPSQGNPFSMETVEAVSVDLAPYDAERGGFTGAAIQAVTKSGTNNFNGTLYARYRTENFRAKHPLTGARDPFVDTTWGLTFGGPMVRNRAFFFFGYEQSQRAEDEPAAGFSPDPAALARLIEITRGYGYEPGALTAPGRPHKSDKKYLGKIDWQISPAHRLSVRYSETRGRQPSFNDYSASGRVSLSGHWHDTTQNLQAWAAQLRSHWRSGWQSEIKIARQIHASQRDPQSRFPQVRVNGIPEEGNPNTKGAIYLGTEEYSQLNEKEVAHSQLAASATRLIGRHRITFGAQREHTDFLDQFLANAYGNYSFSSLDNYAAGKPSSYTYQYVLPGQTAGSHWGMSVLDVHLQDSWQATSRLQFTLGVRAGAVQTKDRPAENPLVESTFGYKNTETADGSYTIGPRLSFIHKFDDEGRTRLSGGAGVFQGRAPGVWLANGYSNTGQSTRLNTSTASGFSPDPDNQFQATAATQRQLVDLIAPGFKLPSIARGNLALEQRLPWQKILVSLEVLHTKTLEGLTYKNLNLNRTGTGPDGRPLYGNRSASGTLASNSYYKNAAFADVFLLTNTSGGHATQWVLSLRKPMGKYWSGSLAYTRSRAVDVSPVTSYLSASNFGTRAAIDPNDERTGTSNQQTRDRFLASASLRFQLFNRSETRLTLVYEGRSGRPYSFVFSNDINGDSASHDNDLFYVPSGRDDPRIRFKDPAQADAFFTYLEATPALAKYAGQIVPRNTERSPFVHQFDLKLVQQLQLGRKREAEIFADIINLGNLLNDQWGRVEQISFPYGQSVANGVFEPGTGKYAYTFTGVRGLTLQPGLSRWQIQAGLRLRF